MINELSKQLELSEEKTIECFKAFLKYLHFITYKEKYLPHTLIAIPPELGDEGLLNYWAIVENIIKKSEANEDVILDWTYRLQNMYSLDSLNLQEYFARVKDEFDKVK
jgi:hypothetical protein